MAMDRGFAKQYPVALDVIPMSIQRSASPQSTPNHGGRLLCKVCSSSIRNAFKKKLITPAGAERPRLRKHGGFAAEPPCFRGHSGSAAGQTPGVI